MTAITKEVTFDCAHMLSGHRGLCANLHGHTYKVQIRIEADLIEDKTNSSNLMIMDFKQLKFLMQTNIVDNFDHALIFSNEEYRNDAENALYDWAVNNNMRHYVMPKRTTAECMAELFATVMKEKYADLYNTSVPVTARVWETPTSFAEVTL